MILLLAGCTSSSVISLDSSEHLQQIKQDTAMVRGQSPPGDPLLELTLSQAISRALDSDLDVRVAALEALVAKNNVSVAEFGMAPNISASGTFTRRNNSAASSSRSILTGTESLEPSTSSDRARRLLDLEAQWNALDAVIAYLGARDADDEATIAKERLRKVKQNIESDVTAAYWRAFAAQEAVTDAHMIEEKSEKFSQALKIASNEKLLSVGDVLQQQRRISAQTEMLNQLREDTAFSQIELKTITSLPLDKDLALTSKPIPVEPLFKDSDFDRLTQIALQSRPELREQFMNSNIADRQIREELISTFPGLNIIYSNNYDSNSFLSDSDWSNFSAALTQSITEFISLPSRYRTAQNQKALEEARRLALTAAIISQVRIAHLRSEIAWNDFKHAEEKVNQEHLKITLAKANSSLSNMSEFDLFIASSEQSLAELEKLIAYADLEAAHADMINTLGLSIDEIKARGMVL